MRILAALSAFFCAKHRKASDIKMAQWFERFQKNVKRFLERKRVKQKNPAPQEESFRMGLALDQKYEVWRAQMLAHPYFALAIAGSFAVLGLAPFFIWPAYGFSIVILIAILDQAKEQKNKFWRLFCRGWIFGFFYFLFGMFWVGAAFLVDAEQFAWLMPIAVTLLPAGLAIFYGLASALYGISDKSPNRVYWFAFCFGVFEYLRSTIFTGLPWNLPAYIWKAGEAISQAGAIIGPFSVSTFTIYIFASLATIKQKNGRATIAFAALIFGAAWLFGVWRLNVPSDSVAAPSPIVAVGNAGFSQKELFASGNENLVAEAYLSLLNSQVAKEANIVVWPEGTFPFLALEDEKLMRDINRSIGDSTLIFGAPRRELGNIGESYFNSIVWLRKGEGLPEELAVYDKFHLVPFGEYLPLGGLFRFLGVSSLVSTGSDFTKGVAPKTIMLPGLPPADARVCYEVIFPNFVPRQEPRADWIVNVSVDAWYGDWLGPDQHYNQARWRAIETGLPLVRAASGGWSAIVNAKGQPVSEIRSGGQMVKAALPPKIENTPYNIHGEIIYGGILVFFAFMGLVIGRTSVLCLLTSTGIKGLLSGKGHKL